MKKFEILLLLSALVLCSCQRELRNEFTFKGHIENFTDSVQLTLFVSSGNTLETIMQEKIGEDFCLQVPYDFSNQELPVLLRLCVGGGGWENRLRDVWVKPEATIHATFRNGETYSAKLRSNVKEQKWQEKLEMAKRDVQEKAFRCEQLGRDCYRRAQEPQLTGEEKQNLVDSANYYWQLRIEALQEEPGHVLEPLRKMPHNKVWWVEMERLVSMASYYPNAGYAADAKELFLSLSNKEKLTDQAQMMQKRLFPPEPYKIGDAEDAELESMDGDTCRLADFRGKYVLLDMWSVGCGACYAAEPKLAEVAEKYAEQLVVISVNTNGLDEWKKYASLNHITWHNMRDTEGDLGLFRKNECIAWPTFILLSPEGRKLDQVAGMPESLDAYITNHWGDSLK